MRSRLGVAVVFYFLFQISLGQNLDSLLTVAKSTKNDSIRIGMYNKIAFSYIFNDTEKAIQVIREGKQMATDAGYYYGLTELTNIHGIYMDVTGQSDSAYYYFFEALELSRIHGFRRIEEKCVNNLGMFNWNKGNFDEALKFFFDALKMNDNNGTERGRGIYLNNIGLIYQEMNLNEKALQYHKESLAIREKLGLKKDQAASLNNIGINLKDLGRLEEAISAYKKGIQVAEGSNNLIDYYRILDNLANAYNEKGNYKAAIENYLKALDKPEGFQADEKSEIWTYSNLSGLYNNINEPKTALLYVNKGFDLLKKYPQAAGMSAELELHAAESYYMLRDFDKARYHTKKYTVWKDSLFSEQNAKAIADLEVKYDTEKKEKEILIQRADLAEQELTIQRKNYQVYGLIGLGIIFGLIGYLFFNQQKLKNQQLVKENELKDALLKIETQNRLQEQRLRISRDLHDNIGAQLTFIISSIDNLKYGFDIKDKKLNQKLHQISRFTSETIYELRDTIWAMNKNEIYFEDLQSRISNYIDKADVYSENIKFTFDVDPTIDQDHTFSSVQGMNIHRIIQEAIHNSLKHSEANQIKAFFEPDGNQLKITISDNGKGFQVDKIKKGSGLNNMEKRAKTISADFLILSQEGKGTQVILKV
ncbi:MAG: tetratricopeptide repeat protein [Psychroserpens sp.]|nr:tetratricopeptide repeat protein [Psychroserpens sp.]